MTENQKFSKKIIIAGLIVVVLALVVGILFRFVFRPAPPAPRTIEDLISSTETAKVPSVGKVETEQIINVENKPAELAKVSLEFGNGLIKPAEFRVKAGAPLIIYIAAVDNDQHIFRFDDPTLKYFATGVQSGQIRTISFITPSKPGRYIYFDESLPRAEAPQGVMIVE